MPGRERFWYFSRRNALGASFDRFGPFATKRDAERARKRARELFHWNVGPIESSYERFASNVPSWAKKA